MDIDTNHKTVIVDSLSILYQKDGKPTAWAQKVLPELCDNLDTELIHYLRAGVSHEEAFGITMERRKELALRILEQASLFSEFKEPVYQRLYLRMEALAKGGASWESLLDEVAIDDDSEAEIYVRIVEELNGRSIASDMDLLWTTGLDKTNKERQEEIKELFYRAMSYRYRVLLENLLMAGATYNELLAVKPSQLNLPETWSIGGQERNQAKTIAFNIMLIFNLNELLFFRPSLRHIAEELQAPYTVIMQAYEEANTWSY